MPPNLHLFSAPGQNGIDDIVEASRPYLADKDDPIIAYLPLASLYAEKWQGMNEEAFKGLARFQTVNAELMSQKEIEKILRDASLVYIPGGNTFLLNHRLHACGTMFYLRKRIQAGLPLVGFSAGAILCGPNILTSKDMNAVQTPHFGGLNATPFNFSPHYPLDIYGQSVKDEWLADYRFFHDNPIVMLSDGAYVKADGRKTILVRGEAWIWRKDAEKEKLEEGGLIELRKDLK
ncbi:MAG: Type 1 glutamine amidotransferase-like domain-containing protein [Anaerolineales bacterium]|nr:Type 1 glutamine amidotransferase-like domain-containing protein [Anaerolineales bacterium]